MRFEWEEVQTSMLGQTKNSSGCATRLTKAIDPQVKVRGKTEMHSLREEI